MDVHEGDSLPGHETGRDRPPRADREDRTWHSLRHTYARVVLEKGAPIFWLSRQLGHSSVQVTQNVYGHWSRSARKTEVEKLAGAFTV